MQLLVSGVVFALVWLVPKVAVACPFCAGRSDNGLIRVIGLGAMITLPFLVVGFVIRSIRRATPPIGRDIEIEGDNQ